jgi:hypothetical protein
MIRRIALLTAGMLLVSGLAFAQASDTGTATAEILAAIEIANVTGLDFGTIAAGSTGTSVVTIAATSLGARTSTGDALLVLSNEGNSAQFDVTAGDGLGYALSFTSGTITLTHTDLVNTMSADLTIDAASGTGTGAAYSHYVGGDLSVGAVQEPGLYTGTFELNAIYQ